MAPERRAKVLPGDTKSKKAMMCLMEKIRVLIKLHSGASYNAIAVNLMLVN